jgi:D-lactate dehydrogenase (quinone)
MTAQQHSNNKSISNEAFINALISIVGAKQVLTVASQTEFYRTGFRAGGGVALAVVFPKTLLEQWYLIKQCVENNKIIIMQAANTGLTAGSTPYGDDYDRDIVIINTTKLTDLILLDEIGSDAQANTEKSYQVLSFSGATLHSLEKKLAPLAREPHSVIGSTCIGASIVGGVANNSGGALIQRGPAYTELALYAQVNAQGELELVNHLGIDLGETPEQILSNLQTRNFCQKDIHSYDKAASAKDYAKQVRDVNATTPARYNADKTRLFEASGCAGKLSVFAVRLDTFKKPEKTKVFYIGVNQANILTNIKKTLLQNCQHLPVAAEYVHRDAFNIAETYGKDTFLFIHYLGTDVIPKLFAAKATINALSNKLPLLPKNIPDKFLQLISTLFPKHLPKPMLAYRDRYQHHLILKVSDDGIDEIHQQLIEIMHSVDKKDGDFFETTNEDGAKAYLHRFAVAGSAIRFESTHENKVSDIIALDVALARNDEAWVETLPAEIANQIEQTLYYGHFFCNVFHRDYLVKKGADVKKIKAFLLAQLDQQHAKYPAEHNVGHLYQADQSLKDFYQRLDPTNSFNPGIGGTSKHRSCQCC